MCLLQEGRRRINPTKVWSYGLLVRYCVQCRLHVFSLLNGPECVECVVQWHWDSCRQAGRQAGG